MIITATYSPEDNKIRLYPSERLDAETYARVKEAGFAWAPKQGLFVAPRWTPAREDLAMQLAGDIEPEEMTLAERAALKAERLEGLAHKRYAEANAFARRAAEIGERFAVGQPILTGHHSERKARKDQERMQSASAQAEKAERASNYWLYRAEGVEWFANMKNAPRVRQGRIKTLLAELRDVQRDINQAHKALAIWSKITDPEKIEWALGNMDSRALMAGFSLWSDVRDGKITAEDARARCMASAERIANGEGRRRWIEHILNRLSYERSMLGPVTRFGGELTPVILQAFAREHGAEKPKATEIDPGFFQLESPLPLPAHLASATYLELQADDWCDLMQSVGYEVPDAKPRRVSSKPAPAPLVNPTLEDAERLQAIWNEQERATAKAAGNIDRAKPNAVKAMTQDVYSRNSGGSYSACETIEISADGRRVWGLGSAMATNPPPLPAVARIRIYSGGGDSYKPRAIVHISDKPAKALPLDLDAIEAATALELANAGEPATLGGLPYDPALLTIKRVQRSVTQATAYLFYNGRKLSDHGDKSERTDSGEYRGHDLDYWHTIARRELGDVQQVAA